MGGKHERLNPHGPVGGRKGPGDVWAEERCGRKGMYRPRRRKGPISREIRSVHESDGPVLEAKESQLITVLFAHHKFSPSVLVWEDIVLVLDAIGLADAELVANDFLEKLVGKGPYWIEYIPFRSLCLRVQHLSDIKEFLRNHPVPGGLQAEVSGRPSDLFSGS